MQEKSKRAWPQCTTLLLNVGRPWQSGEQPAIHEGRPIITKWMPNRRLIRMGENATSWKTIDRPTITATFAFIFSLTTYIFCYTQLFSNLTQAIHAMYLNKLYVQLDDACSLSGDLFRLWLHVRWLSKKKIRYQSPYQLWSLRLFIKRPLNYWHQLAAYQGESEEVRRRWTDIKITIT